MSMQNGSVRWLVPTSRLQDATILINGKAETVPAGIPVIMALHSLGITHLRNSPRTNEPRGGFCLMGACQECVVPIDGMLRPACMTMTSDGMSVLVPGYTTENNP